MPVYDLFGKTLRVDMNNNNRESMAKVRGGQVDVGVGNYGASLKKATDLRILHVSRGIPLAGVYIAPKLTSQDQKLVTELLLAAPPTVQSNARYAAGSPIDYSEFLKVVKRVEEITSCANWKVNPVKFYCGNGSGNTSSTSSNSGTPMASTQDSITGTTGGYSAYDNRVEFTLQGAERKVYRLILPRTVIDRDPDLDSPTALNFKKVTIKGVQPVEVNGVLELHVTAPGQVKVVN